MGNNPKFDLENEYSIVEAEDYNTAAAGVPSPAAPGLAGLTRLVGKAPAAKTISKRAVWIVHGMGQQLPFETLDSVTSGLRRIIDLENEKTAKGQDSSLPKDKNIPRLRTVKFGEQIVQRVELDVKNEHGEKGELHLYEAYWAPMTEGVAKLSDVISFLFDGGWRGLLNSLKKFQRAMFGNMEEFPVRRMAIAEILLTLFTVLSLIVINAVVVASATLANKIPLLGGLSMNELWPPFTALASCMCSVALTFGTLLFLGEMSKPRDLAVGWRMLVSVVGWAGFLFTLFSIIGTAALMILALEFRAVGEWLSGLPVADVQLFSTLLILADALLVLLALSWRESLRKMRFHLRGDGFLVFLFGVSFLVQVAAILVLVLAAFGKLPKIEYFAWLSNPLWVWPFLIVLASNVRTLLVQYVGDVGIYITSNKLDRFDQVRKGIKKAAWESAANVYAAVDKKTGDVEYEKIAVVGHSLGSVIAYDTLNRLLTDDELMEGKGKVAERTCLLETFGSPLDKTAFFFTLQGKSSFHVREQMASLVQPLIQSYRKFRTFPWINVYSKNDIVSGDLFLYDPPEGSPNDCANGDPEFPVWNIADKQAVVPLAAHVDYWKNDMVWQLLYDVIVLNKKSKPSPQN